MRNATTDSPWPISNNPYAKYNERSRLDCNLALPLWQLVRASTAAPTYFPPEVVVVGNREFIFVDGGVTMSTILPSRCSSWRQLIAIGHLRQTANVVGQQVWTRC